MFSSMPYIFSELSFSFCFDLFNFFLHFHVFFSFFFLAVQLHPSLLIKNSVNRVTAISFLEIIHINNKRTLMRFQFFTLALFFSLPIAFTACPSHQCAIVFEIPLSS